MNSSISIMRCDFIFISCFSGVLKNLGIAAVRELGSDYAMFPCYLLVMFLHLTFAIWLSRVLAFVPVSNFG